MYLLRRIAIAASLALIAVGASANNFRAADQVYFPAMARIVSGASLFKTDVVVSNLSDATVDVDVAFSSGTTGTANAVSAANLRRVGTLAPGERKEIIDFVQTVLGQSTAFGQAIFFGCQAGGDCSDCDANPAACKNISVEGRIYAEQTTGCRGGSAVCTNGQLFSGIPFYNYASVTAQDRNLDKVTIVGIRQSGSRATATTPGSGYRSNLGFINASNTSSTVLKVTLYANNAPTTPLGVAFKTPTLGPLGQMQANVTDMFPGFSGSGFVIVEQESYTPNPGETSAVPGFVAYGSVLDNVTDDPTTLEAQYIPALDFACVYGTAKPERRLIKRK